MSSMNTMTVLVADDSEFFRTKISNILTHAGYKVRFARDGVEVLNELKSNSSEIDLLMLDLHMPHINGFEVLRWIKKNNLNGQLPILAITGAYEPTEVLKKLRELGATGLVTKSTTSGQLIFRVNKLLFEGKIESRAASRIPVTFHVDVTTCRNAVLKGFVLNLSKTGAFIFICIRDTKEGIEIGDVIHLRFSLSEQDKLIEAEAKIVWVKTLDAAHLNPLNMDDANIGSEDNLFNKGIGAHFLNIDPEDREIIERFVKKEAEKPM
ncbi:MAG: response regulator [Thermodesulfobacteriota bacterium]